MSRTLDFAKVEQELGVKLPSFFIEFHQNEEVLIQELRALNNDFDYITISSDADWMIEHNRDFLGLPRDEGMCRNKLCIGTDGCGNDSFISLDGKDQRVYFLDHEDIDEFGFIDEENEDFKWEHEELSKFDSPADYVKFYISLYKG